MFGINYFKADPSTFVLKTVDGKIRKKGRGLSFFYNAAVTSVAAIPVNVQESPFIFNLQTADFQTVSVQGQISWKIDNPEKTAEMLNFNLQKGGPRYASEDPLKLSDRVVRAVQSIVQSQIQAVKLRDALGLTQRLVLAVRKLVETESAIEVLGINVLNVVFSAITPTPETARALEAEVRESILKEADDAIYARRKAAVEQERTIKEAELQTDLLVQQKEQELEEFRIQNERAIMRGQIQTEKEKLEAKIDAERQNLNAEIEAENKRREYVELNVLNNKQAAEAEAYAIAERMRAYTQLPVENLKAMALANMQPEQLMAMAFDTLAQNAGKIGELNINPDLINQLLKKVGKQ